MKVAIYSESPADEAALRILVDALRGEATEPAHLPCRLASRGVESVFNLLSTVIRALHYNSNAEALVVVVDSNHTPIDPAEPNTDGARAKRCRLTRLREIVEQVTPTLKPVADRPALRVALGLAVPAIEAWYLCGHESGISEEAWAQGLAAGKEPYSKARLKQLAYGTDRPSLAIETERAVEHARRVAAGLGLLDAKFPVGFGSFARDVRNWGA